GHAGAIISGGAGTAAEKIETFRKAGVPVASTPAEIPALVEKALGKSKKGKIPVALAKPKKKAPPVKMRGLKSNHIKKAPALAAKQRRKK
ncbi:MAG: succinate--CoA ligase subunit alpha, partial [Limisphaerales bacterium]